METRKAGELRVGDVTISEQQQRAYENAHKAPGKWAKAKKEILAAAVRASGPWARSATTDVEVHQTNGGVLFVVPWAEIRRAAPKLSPVSGDRVVR